jgi:integrase
MLEIPDPDTLKGARDRAILHIMFYTGCRISEISSLKVKDFYEDGGYWVLDFVVKGGKRNKLAIHQELQITIMDYLAMSGHGQPGKRSAADYVGAKRLSAGAVKVPAGQLSIPQVRAYGRPARWYPAAFGTGDVHH